MRSSWTFFAVLGAGLLASPAVAQSSDNPADEAPAGNAEMKQKLLENFDTNKDGQLDRSEARAIGRALRENFDIGPGPGGPGPEGRSRPDGPPPGERRGPEGRRGRGPEDGPPPGDRGPRGRRRGDGEGRGPGARGPGGPDGPPRPERLFNRFDENEDGSLSLEEFKELSEFVRERFHQGPPLAMRGRGFDGPPRGGFERRGGEGRPRRDWRDGPPGPPRGERPPRPDDAGEGPEDPI